MCVRVTGDRGDNLYIVESGSFDIFVKDGNKQRKVAHRGDGTAFGELALMYNAPRAATVTVRTLQLHACVCVFHRLYRLFMYNFHNSFLKFNFFYFLYVHRRRRIV